uniref:N-acetyltransferase domain-containing protein n=1 Tax=Schizaphis graminum TaxID=13262 RepID=A0A2S2NH58_SCHGA
MFVKQFSGVSAINNVKKFVNKYEAEIDSDLKFIIGWYTVNMDHNVHAFILYQTSREDSAASILLLSKCDFDPLKQQRKPHILDFVYTIRSRRKRGYAAKLIAKAQANFQFTVFCKNDETSKMFANLKCIKNDTLSDSTNLNVFRWDICENK